MPRARHLTEEERRAARARGALLAARVAGDLMTGDVMQLAARAGVRVLFERWALVTVGECERRARLIRVNLAALDGCRRAHMTERELTDVIVAHELGHLFQEEAATTARESEEVAHGFAARLLGVEIEDYERFWRG